jgi:hypothetical protein
MRCLTVFECCVLRNRIQEISFQGPSGDVRNGKAVSSKAASSMRIDHNVDAFRRKRSLAQVQARKKSGRGSFVRLIGSIPNRNSNGNLSIDRGTWQAVSARLTYRITGCFRLPPPRIVPFLVTERKR